MVSPANIAGGSGRGGSKEMAYFLRIAQRSAHEAEYHLLLARDLDLIEVVLHRQIEQKIIETQRMLAGLISTIASKN